MGRGFYSYRPAHSAHGAAYRAVVMWPYVLGRSIRQLSRGGTRTKRRGRNGSPDEATRAMPARRSPLGPPPPPPPPPGVAIPKVWNLEEGAVRPQWTSTLEINVARRKDLLLRAKRGLRRGIDAARPTEARVPRP